MMELVYNLLSKVRIQKHILQFLEIGDFIVSDPSACGFLVSRAWVQEKELSICKSNI